MASPKQCIQLVSLLTVFALISPMLSALEIRVVDSEGSPIRDAVVTWGLENSEWPQGVTDRALTRRSETAVMDQIKRQFVPFVLPVDRGQKVAFPNSDQVHHHVYSFSKAKRFEIELYANEPVSPITFDRPGRVVLGCNIHDSMVAYIYVTDSPVFDTTNGKGWVRFQSQGVEPDFIEVWHPWMGPEAIAKRIDGVSQTKESLVVTLDVTAPKPKKSFKNRFSRFRENRDEDYDESGL